MRPHVYVSTCLKATHPGLLIAALLFIISGMFLSADPSWGEMYVYDSTLPGQLWYFNSPYSVAVDVSGNVYVADTLNNVVLKYNSSGVLQHTFGVAGVSGSDNDHFNYPYGVAVDGSGNVYVADSNNHRIQKFDASLAYAGTLGTTGVSGNDATHLNTPNGVAVDGTGNVYVADTVNDRVQIFTSGGTSTLSGFNRPIAVAVGSDGRVYVADTNNNRIQVFDAGLAYLTTIGTTGFSGTDNSHFDTPQGVVVDSSGNIYVADTNNHRIQKCTLSTAPPVPTCVTFLGVTSVPGINNAHLNMPNGVTVDGTGNVYIADTWNWRIQKFTGAGVYVSTWGSAGSDNGHLNYPDGVAVDGSGNVHVADTDNHRIQQFDSGGVYVNTLGETGVLGTPPDNTHFNYPSGIAAGGNKIYVADTYNDRIQIFDLGGYQSSSEGSPTLNSPFGVALDTSNNIYVADTMNHVIRQYGSSGFFTSTLIGTVGLSGTGNYDLNYPSGIAVDGSGNIYVADTNNHRIQKFNAAVPPVWQLQLGVTGDPGGLTPDNAHFDSPSGVAVDGSGNIYVADTNNHRIQKFTAGGTWLLTLGEAGVSGYDNAHFNLPNGIAVDGSGNIYVADTYNHRVQKFLRQEIITVLPGLTNGSITCPITQANYGSSPSCTITPDAGYYISDLRVGPSADTLASVAAASPYTFTGISSDMAIYAIFTTYPIKLVSGSDPNSFSYHGSLASAYSAASAGVRDIMKIQNLPSPLIEDLTIAKPLTMEGGYDYNVLAFSSRASGAVSVVEGLIEITTGSLIVDGIVIR